MIKKGGKLEKSVNKIDQTKKNILCLLVIANWTLTNIK